MNPHTALPIEGNRSKATSELVCQLKWPDSWAFSGALVILHEIFECTALQRSWTLEDMDPKGFATAVACTVPVWTMHKITVVWVVSGLFLIIFGYTSWR